VREVYVAVEVNVEEVLAMVVNLAIGVMLVFICQKWIIFVRRR
jgi:hypothetical protein